MGLICSQHTSLCSQTHYIAWWDSSAHSTYLSAVKHTVQHDGDGDDYNEEEAADSPNDTDSEYNYGLDQLAGSVLGSLSHSMQRHGFNPPLRRIFPIRGIFALELTWVLTPFPQNSFGWEYKPRSSLCTHAFHCTDSKDPDIHVLDGWTQSTKGHPACTIHEDRMWLPQWVD